jgi:hypothetical protein
MAPMDVNKQPNPRTVVTRITAAAIVFAGIFAYVSTFRNALIDDAFIQLKYAHTFATSGTWGFFPGRITNTATSPLNVVLTALFDRLAPSSIDAVVWLTSVEFFLILVFLRLTAATLFGSYYFAALAFVGLIANPLLVSTFGLEGVLFTLGITASLYCLVAGRWIALAVALGFLTLTRADGFLLFVVAMLLLPASWTTRLRSALVYGLVLTPWYLYSWIHLGSIIPDTMKIKMGQQAWSAWLTFFHGPLAYLDVFPLATAFSFGMLLLGLLLIGRTNRTILNAASILGAYGVLHFAAYSTIKVPPYHWYYVSQVVPCVLIGALGAARLFERWAARPAAYRAILRAAVLAPATAIAVMEYADGFRLKEVPIHSNWAPHDTYKEMGLWLKANTDPSATIFCATELGTLAFYSERYLINEFNDLNRVSETMLSGVYYDKPIVGPLMRINYYWRRLQPPFPDYQYRLQNAADDQAERAEISQHAIKTWEVTSKWIEWRTARNTMLYSLTPVARTPPR